MNRYSESEIERMTKLTADSYIKLMEDIFAPLSLEKVPAIDYMNVASAIILGQLQTLHDMFGCKAVQRVLSCIECSHIHMMKIELPPPAEPVH